MGGNWLLTDLERSRRHSWGGGNWGLVWGLQVRNADFLSKWRGRSTAQYTSLELQGRSGLEQYISPPLYIMTRWMVLFCLAEVSLHIILCRCLKSQGGISQNHCQAQHCDILKRHIPLCPSESSHTFNYLSLTTSSKGGKIPKGLIPAGKTLEFSVATLLKTSLSFFWFLDLPRAFLILNS